MRGRAADDFPARFLKRSQWKLALRGTRRREADHARVAAGNRVRFVLDKTTPANMSADETFGFQKFVGGRNCRPVQSKLTSQFAGWRQPFAVEERTAPNLLPNRIRDLAIDRSG